MQGCKGGWGGVVPPQFWSGSESQKGGEDLGLAGCLGAGPCAGQASVGVLASAMVGMVSYGIEETPPGAGGCAGSVGVARQNAAEARVLLGWVRQLDEVGRLRLVYGGQDGEDLGLGEVELGEESDVAFELRHCGTGETHHLGCFLGVKCADMAVGVAVLTLLVESDGESVGAHNAGGHALGDDGATLDVRRHQENVAFESIGGAGESEAGAEVGETPDNLTLAERAGCLHRDVGAIDELLEELECIAVLHWVPTVARGREDTVVGVADESTLALDRDVATVLIESEHRTLLDGPIQAGFLEHLVNGEIVGDADTETMPRLLVGPGHRFDFVCHLVCSVRFSGGRPPRQ